MAESLGGERCPVCGARWWAPTQRRLRYGDGSWRRFEAECQSCGTLRAEGANAADFEAELATRLLQDRFWSRSDDPFALSLYTLRIAASRRARLVRALDAAGRDALVRPHGIEAADADLGDFPDAACFQASLAILCRAGELAAVLAGVPFHADWTDDVVVLVDGEGEARDDGIVRLRYRPLGDDFSAQRNAAQVMARYPFVLQLDADETIGRGVRRLLRALPEAAGEGVRSIGLPRKNFVDGARADLWPDVQYRLNRREVRFAGRVHERPVVDGWAQTTIALSGAIRHQLSREHVERRSQRYEEIAPGEGRLFERGSLLQPFRP
ncbi:hypothetical protein [Aureimonas jatrophae]|uniref:Glycosyl transferase family 2 n=1 Tax=Aureimonas jatrophae TaxID=1166073 RepID=A0A1H0ERD0_9HYPH|nr:hypothetical protein [Aureimonas jatrophae]MBB3950353.1 hypothetical protein [Aureimonas jatrophae]SDN84910.1 hypothetical protein SAMN05192530_102183 [Aureimonas jatrophae]